MSNHTDDWTDLKKVWRAQPDDREMYNRYRTQVQREKRRLQFEMGAEVLLSLLSAAIFAWWAAEADGVSRLTFIILSAFAVAMPIVTFFMRRTLWRAQTDTVASHRMFLRRRARLGLTFARIGYIGGPAGVAAGFLLAGQLEVRVTGTDGITALVLACLALTVMCWWSLSEAGKWRLTLEQLDAYKEEDLDADR